MAEAAYNPDNPTGIYDPSQYVQNIRNYNGWQGSSTNRAESFTESLDPTKNAKLKPKYAENPKDQFGNPLPATAYEYIMQGLNRAKQNGNINKYTLRTIESGAKAYYALDPKYDISGSGILNNDRWLAKVLNQNATGTQKTNTQNTTTQTTTTNTNTQTQQPQPQQPVTTTGKNNPGTGGGAGGVKTQNTTTQTTQSTGPQIDNTKYRNTQKEILDKLAQTYPDGSIKELELNIGQTRDQIINYLWNEAVEQYGQGENSLDSKINYIITKIGQMINERQLVTDYADKMNKSREDNLAALNKSSVDYGKISDNEIRARNGGQVVIKGGLKNTTETYQEKQAQAKKEAAAKQAQQTQQNMTALNKSTGQASAADTFRRNATASATSSSTQATPQAQQRQTLQKISPELKSGDLRSRLSVAITTMNDKNASSYDKVYAAKLLKEMANKKAADSKGQTTAKQFLMNSGLSANTADVVLNMK